jgi:hypothetical protein
MAEKASEKPSGARWISGFQNVSPLETYLIAVRAIMFGSIPLSLWNNPTAQRRNRNAAETLDAIRKDLEKAGAEINGERQR